MPRNPPRPSWLAAALVVVAACLAAVVAPARSAPADEPPVIPVGLDAYRQWEKWPQQRIGVRAYMRSTYDRTGLNEGADASHFLYQTADDFNVTLDVAGSGILYFARYNHWHGSPWHYVVDGTDHVVRESSSATPDKPVANSTFEPRELFPNPLTWTWSDTKGADLMWVPIPFERSFTMAYSRTHYGTGYYIFHQFVPGTKLSQPIKAWDGKAPPDKDVLELIGRAGTDLTPAEASGTSGGLILPANATRPVGAPSGAPGVLRKLTFSVPEASAVDFGRARLRITWDGRPHASVDAPVAMFFGAGVLYNRDGREHLVKAFPVNIRYAGGRVHLACYFPMPFTRSARIELVGGETDVSDVRFSVAYEPLGAPANHLAYFHATYRDHGPDPERGKDLVLLDTREVEGGGDWSGSFIGTSWIFSHNAVLNTLEGDPRFYFDDSQSPQAYGTGTEEWGGGGDYWGGRNMTLPFAGHPCGAPGEKDAKNDLDKIQSAYRFLLADLMPFGKNARITLEHGGANDTSEHYETVTYWYGAPAPSLVQTDELKVGDVESERSHAYASPDASEPYELTSRYEWGPDTLDGTEIFPATADRGRRTTGTSEFTIRLEPDNHGVMLRRKLDYGFPNQRAEVFIADVPEAGAAAAAAATPNWKPAGVWYTAGSNTCVYSNPRDELGATQHIAQTSNRRFRDDEFLIAQGLTRGRKAVRVRVRFTPVEIPLFPGHPLPELAWSEMRYTAYCYVMPKWAP
jgi:hypothetical protein